MSDFKRAYSKLDSVITETEKRLSDLINECVNSKNKDKKLEYALIIEEVAQVLVRLNQINAGFDY